jgi:hypothetical protein
VRDQCHLLGAGGVDHRPHIVHPLLERRELVQRDRVRHAGAPLVEQNQPAERSEACQEASVVRLFPLPFDMIQPVADEDHINGAVAGYLVRDVPLFGVRVPRLGNVNHAGSS